MGARRLDIDEVTARLGVKRETVYAYVSRGYLGSRPSADGRTSTFDPAEVDALAQRSRPRRRPRRGEGIDVTLSSAITQLQDGSVSYRGLPLAALVAGSRFEAVAELLWSGQLPDTGAATTWPVATATVDAVRASVAHLPARADVGTRLRAAVVAAGALAPSAHDLRPDAVMATGRALIATVANALAGPPPGEGDTIVRPMAEAVATAIDSRLAARWRAPLDVALVLLADHELATSTLAARVAASTRADPAAAVLAGMATVSGPLHGSASVSVQRFIVAADDDPDAAVLDELRRHGQLPGFGHPVHQRGDPRAPLLLDALRAATATHQRDGRRLAAAERIIEVAAERGVAAPNVDFALGALGHTAGLALGSTELIFSLSRMAGWIAHAMEEYGETPLRFRSRSR